MVIGRRAHGEVRAVAPANRVGAPAQRDRRDASVRQRNRNIRDASARVVRKRTWSARRGPGRISVERGVCPRRADMDRVKPMRKTGAGAFAGWRRTRVPPETPIARRVHEDDLTGVGRRLRPDFVPNGWGHRLSNHLCIDFSTVLTRSSMHVDGNVER